MKSYDLESELNAWFDVIEPSAAHADDVLANVFAVTRREGQRSAPVARLVTRQLWTGLPASQIGFRFALVMLALLVALIGVALAAGAIHIPPPPRLDGAIAFERWAVPPEEWSPQDYAPPRAIALARPDGTVSVITPPDREEACATFSPDGSRVALYSAPRRTSDYFDPAYELAVADAVPGAPRQFLAPGRPLPQVLVGAPSWAPDGSAVVAVVLRPDQPMPINGDLVLVPLDGSPLRPILESPLVSEGEQRPGMYRFHGAHWSPDGMWITFRGERFDGQAWRYFIAVIRPDGSDLRLLDQWPLRGSIEWGSVVWSPDSAWVAYHRRPPGARAGGMDVYVASIADGGVRRLTETRSHFVGEWSPDGSRIVTLGINGGGSHVLEVATGAVTALPPATSTSGATWSADGNRIAILEDEGLWVVDRDGSNAREVRPESVLSHCAGMGPGISWQELAR